MQFTVILPQQPLVFQFRLSSSIASNKRRLRPQRKQRAAVNPLKALLQRDDLINEEDIKNAPKVFFSRFIEIAICKYVFKMVVWLAYEIPQKINGLLFI